MAIAGYNAGPNRVRQWIQTYGDPRTEAVDVVDWIELIPISETRNYVQRVLEAVQVYRARLNGDRAEPNLGPRLAAVGEAAARRGGVSLTPSAVPTARNC